MQTDLEALNQVGEKYLPGLIGVKVLSVGEGTLEAEIDIQQGVMAPHGYLHAGAVVSLADSACGYGCMMNLPEGATGFTTIELKSNFVGTAREGKVKALAKATQVWEAKVLHVETEKVIAHFSCTQMVLWPRK